MQAESHMNGFVFFFQDTLEFSAVGSGSLVWTGTVRAHTISKSRNYHTAVYNTLHRRTAVAMSYEDSSPAAFQMPHIWKAKKAHCSTRTPLPLLRRE